MFEGCRGKAQGGQPPGGNAQGVRHGRCWGRVMEERKVWNRKDEKKQDKSAPRTRLSNAQKVEILDLLGRKMSHVVIAYRYGCGPRTISRITETRVSIAKLVASGSTKASSSKGNRSGDDTTGRGGGVLPPYVERSSHFVSLEIAAEACGNGDASFYLRKARMSFIKAHVSKPVKQADMRQFCEPKQGQGGGHSRRL